MRTPEEKETALKNIEQQKEKLKARRENLIRDSRFKLNQIDAQMRTLTERKNEINRDKLKRTPINKLTGKQL